MILEFLGLEVKAIEIYGTLTDHVAVVQEMSLESQYTGRQRLKHSMMQMRLQII